MPLPIKAWSTSTRLICRSCEELEESARRACEEFERDSELVRSRRYAAFDEALDKIVTSSVGKLGRERGRGQVVYRVRLADTYWPSGKKFREVLMIVGDRSGPEERIRVMRGSNGSTLGRVIGKSEARSISKELAAPALGMLQSLARSGRGEFDSPMDWIDVYGPLKNRPAEVICHWIKTFGLVDVDALHEILDRHYRATGEAFLSVAPQLSDTMAVGLLETEAMLKAHLPSMARLRYRWDERNGKWFMLQDRVALRWTSDIEARLWPVSLHRSTDSALTGE